VNYTVPSALTATLTATAPDDEDQGESEPHGRPRSQPQTDEPGQRAQDLQARDLLVRPLVNADGPWKVRFVAFCDVAWWKTREFGDRWVGIRDVLDAGDDARSVVRVVDTIPENPSLSSSWMTTRAGSWPLSTVRWITAPRCVGKRPSSNGKATSRNTSPDMRRV
jgi:hypothetical protein